MLPQTLVSGLLRHFVVIFTWSCCVCPAPEIIKYGSFDDATLNDLASDCIDPMIETFRKEIDKRSGRCPNIRLRCDGFNVVTRQSITVQCATTLRLDEKDDKNVNYDMELTSTIKMLAACVLPGVPTTEEKARTALATSMELVDRLCDNPSAPTPQIYVTDAATFLGGLKAKLQRPLKSPENAFKIGSFAMTDVFEKIKAEGGCKFANLECPAKDSVLDPTIAYGGKCNAEKMAALRKSDLLVDASRDWETTYKMYISNGIVRKYRASPRGDKDFRPSKIRSVMNQLFCPDGTEAKGRVFNAWEIVRSAKLVVI